MKEDTAPRRCAVAGCQIEPPEGAARCPIHSLIAQLGKEAQKATRRAQKSNDLMSIFLARAATFGLETLDPLVAKATKDRAAEMPGPQPGVPPAPPIKPDPFAILGLEKGCTSADVRGRQRKLAAIFHPDLGGGPTASARLAEINNAASACLKILRSK